jgi:hypothetical protein
MAEDLAGNEVLMQRHPGHCLCERGANGVSVIPRQEVWTRENHARTQRLAGRLVDGMRGAFEDATNNVEAGERDVPAVRHLQRVYIANRGIFEFGWWCGPAVAIQATDEDIDRYLDVVSAFVRDLLG